MSQETINKITDLLCDEVFYEKNRDLSDSSEIVAAIQQQVPEATEEEIDKVLSCISMVAQGSADGEISESDLSNVSGGFGITITLTTVLTAMKIAGAVGAAGAAIGTAVWYWRH